MNRCKLVARCALVLCLASDGAALAADPYPTRPIRIVVPLSAGAADTLARVIAAKLGEHWNQPVIVENRPGGGTTIGTDLVAKAPADGYTLLMATFSHAVNATFYRRLPYDTVKDFSAVTLVASAPNVLEVPPSSAANTVDELIAMAKAQPDKLNFASAGNGSSSHLAGELFKNLTGTRIVHVPYKGAAPALNDLLGGRVEMSFDPLPSSLAHIRAGKLRPLAVTTATRSSVLPNVPTLAEAGVKGYELNGWSGLLVRAGTPPEVVQVLNAQIVKILRTPDIKNRFESLGFETVGDSPAQFQAFIESEIAKWRKVVTEANIFAE